MTVWTNYSNNFSLHANVRELEQELSAAHSSLAHTRRTQRNLRSELSRVRGSLEERINRVSASLDAFIELSDIRATLAMFDSPALARHRTLQMLDGRSVPTLDLTDVPGYWLVPAAEGLHALLTGDTDTARLRFDEADRRDAARTRYFTALASALTDAEYARSTAGAITTELLPHLPEPTTELTRGERALWLLTADGAFGDDAREHLKVSTIRHWADRQVTVAPPAGLTPPQPVSRRRSPGPGNDNDTMKQRVRAAESLTSLRQKISRIQALGSEDLPQEELDPDELSADFLRETLRLLVEEGTLEEAPLLSRAAELRAVIEKGGEDQRAPHWGDTVSTVDSYLNEDLTREDAPPHRHTFALELQAPAVMDMVENLEAQAKEPVEDLSSTNIQGIRIKITSEGVSPGELSAAQARLSSRSAVEGSGTGIGVVSGLGLAAVLLVPALAAQAAFLWVLVVLALAGAGFAYYWGRRQRQDDESYTEAQQRQLETQAFQAAERWKQKIQETAQHGETAQREAEEIRRLLAPSS